MKLLRAELERTVKRFQSRYPSIETLSPGVDFPPEPEMGDYAVALPLRASDPLERPPRDVGEELATFLQQQLEELERVRVEGPGFVNCTFRDRVLLDEITRQLNRKTLPYPSPGEDRRVLIEFVSANPTGPLHVGHGRGAVYGDVLARIFSRHGFDVSREYYVNDTGGQVQRLGESIRLRAREREGETVQLEDQHYKGTYLKDLVEQRALSSEQPADQLADIGVEAILEGIFSDLEDCRIRFDDTVRESEVATETALQAVLDRLREGEYLYEKEGALFVRTTEGGDDKDRVLIRANGEPTYFANDLVYHHRKFQRNFDRYVDVWGHDHHGYQNRLVSGLSFLGDEVDRLEIELYQLVDLYRGGDPVSMSTRGGEFVPLSDLVEEVGVDAVRFNFLTTNHNRPLDFDIEVATAQTEENPVYYVQYAHTRLASILRNAPEHIDHPATEGELTPEGHHLLVKALDFPHASLRALRARQPHQITYQLRELARKFHAYYTQHRVIAPDHPRRTGVRLGLVSYLKFVIASGLQLLGVTAPDRM